MAKLTIATLSGGFASVDALNAIFDDLETALEQCVYRDGSTPNQMNADFDMNSNDILNVGDLTVSGSLTVDGTDYVAAVQNIYNDYLSITQNATISTSPPSGGSDGDVWYQV